MRIELQQNEKNFEAMARIMAATDPWITLGKTFEDCLGSLRGEGKEVYSLIEETGETVGVVVLQMTGTFRGYLQSICIDARARGKGYGHQAIAFCERRIFSVSPNFFLCVSSFNLQAQKLYFSLGFEQVGLLKNLVAEGYDELLLRKTTGSYALFKPTK